MPLTELTKILEIKDPVRGYIGVTETEAKILDLRIAQRLRNIRWPAGAFTVYPGAETSLLGHMLGYLDMTELLFDSLGADAETIQLARLSAMLYSVARGAWGNVMEEYLETFGSNRTAIAELAIQHTAISDILADCSFSKTDVVTALRQGIPIKTVRVNLNTFPINPELMDSLERDAYFAGVDYAPIEHKRLFDSIRIAKNKLVVARSARYTLESFLSAGANMFEAVYYHKTVRATELMLLRILELAGPELFDSPAQNPMKYFQTDDLSFQYALMQTAADASDNFKIAGELFNAFRRRDLIKVAGVRSISDVSLLEKLRSHDGRRDIEREIAEESGIDPLRLYVDCPDRTSVTFYPGKYPLSEIAMYERGTRGYEFWPVEAVSRIAKTLSKPMRTVRIYTTRGYRTRVKRIAQSFLESFDSAGSNS